MKYNAGGDIVTGLGDNFSGDHLVIPGTYNGVSVIAIGDDAFTNNESFKELTISEGVTMIGAASFSSCENLQIISIPSSMREISEFAFAGCLSLVEIHYAGTIEQWTNDVSCYKNGLMSWDYGTENYTIYCTNGQIAADGTITKN